MKNLVLSMLAIASITAMNSCSSESDPINEVTGGDNVEIKLNAGTIGIETKAPIKDLTNLSAGKIGIYAIDDNTWTASPRINNQSSATDGLGAITFDDSKKYYYPSTGSVNFYAYYPYSESITASGEGTAPSLGFTITGEEDLMYATSVSGDKNTPPTDELNFNHVLTQIQFNVKAGTIPAGIKLLSIKVIDVNDKGVMDITTGTLSGWGKSTADVTIDAKVTGSPVIDNTAADAGSPIMLQPGQANFKIEVVTDMGTYTDIEIKPEGGDAGFLAGKAYDVLLTFNATEIAVKAAVTPWAEGTGSGAVQ